MLSRDTINDDEISQDLWPLQSIDITLYSTLFLKLAACLTMDVKAIEYGTLDYGNRATNSTLQSILSHGLWTTAWYSSPTCCKNNLSLRGLKDPSVWKPTALFWPKMRGKWLKTQSVRFTVFEQPSGINIKSYIWNTLPTCHFINEKKKTTADSKKRSWAQSAKGKVIK